MSLDHVERNAADLRNGLTLSELERLIDQARSVGLPADAVVTGRIDDHGALFRLRISMRRR